MFRTDELKKNKSPLRKERNQETTMLKRAMVVYQRKYRAKALANCDAVVVDGKFRCGHEASESNTLVLPTRRKTCRKCLL